MNDPAHDENLEKALEQQGCCEPAASSSSPPANSVTNAGYQVPHGQHDYSDDHAEVREKSTPRGGQDQKAADEQPAA
jgi:hypothetical protein